jgi:hypothetical protein
VKALFVLLLLAIGAMAAWSLVDPQSAFRATQGRMFRDPSTVRLSRFAVVTQRVVGAVVLVVVLVTLVTL